MHVKSVVTFMYHINRLYKKYEITLAAHQFVPTFKCLIFKYIGSLDVAKPTSRIEIVAAMRRIRV